MAPVVFSKTSFPPCVKEDQDCFIEEPFDLPLFKTNFLEITIIHKLTLSFVLFYLCDLLLISGRCVFVPTHLGGGRRRRYYILKRVFLFSQFWPIDIFIIES